MIERLDSFWCAQVVWALKARPERLDHAALAIAKIEHPNLVPFRYCQILDRYAARIKVRGLRKDHATRLQRLRRGPADEEGFRGNTQEYDAPQNSFINVVMDSRRGLPITLSIIYMEVARRAGIPLYGVAFPGHFLVACDLPGRKLVMDPFNAGSILDNAGCAELLRRTDPKAQFSPSMIAPATPLSIVQRLLTNLKGSYLKRGDGGGILKVVDILLALSPNDPNELRMRAALFSLLGAFRAALADVERCIQLSPTSPDHATLVMTAKSLRDRAKYVN